MVEPRPVKRQRQALVVLGMHRSGTSAMARVLSLSGAALPTGLMGPGAANPEGHWEPAEVADFNDRILAEMDSEWSDAFGPRDFRKRRFPVEQYLDEAVQIVRRNYGDASLIVFKEPRVSILLELWRQALTHEEFRITFVIMVRHPDEVARSLQKRDGLPYNQGLLIWSTYMLSAELGTRGASRIFVNFDQLLNDPEDVLDRVEAGLGVNLARRTWDSREEIQGFLKSEIKHFSFSGSASMLKKLEPVQKFYDFLHAASLGEPWNVDFTDEMSLWLGDIEQAVGPVLKHLERALRLARAELDSASARESALADEAASVRRQIDEREQQSAAQLAKSQAEAAEQRERADQLEIVIDAGKAAAAAQQANALDRLAVQQAQIEASAAATKSADLRIEALERELEEKSAALANAATLEATLSAAAANAKIAADESARREVGLRAQLTRMAHVEAARDQELARGRRELEMQRRRASEAEESARALATQVAIEGADLKQRLEHAMAEASAYRDVSESRLGAAAAREAELRLELSRASASAEADRAEKAQLAQALLDAIQARSQTKGFWRAMFRR